MTITAASAGSELLAHMRGCADITKHVVAALLLSPLHFPSRSQTTVMSVFFVGHIHFYGQSQYLFGDLGPVVAWPLIMSSTVSRDAAAST